jgi:hypothetical protein
MLNNLFNASQEKNSRILLHPDAEDNEFLIRVSFYQKHHRRKISFAVTLPFHYIDCPLTAV